MGGWWADPVRRVVDGRRVVLAGGVPAMWSAMHDLVRQCGATDVAVFATEGAGAGAGPDCTTVVVEPPAGIDMMTRIRWGNRAMADPPEAARAALDAFDPDRSAVVLGQFLAECPTLDGRPLLTYRRPQWIALEDKTIVDALWGRAGVTAAPAVTVPVEAAWIAARELDAGSGTVWAGDASAGWHGGATLTEWVRDEAEAGAAVSALAGSCREVRVMPFLDGIPCSVHGIVCDDGVVALRPVEMVTMRQDRRFVYAGCATYWDPPDEVRDEMRAAARRVGELLAAEVAYRGAFTVDGVATSDGFRPTELNPRPGAGLVTIGRGLPDGFPLLLVIDLIAAGHDIGRTATDIEAELVDAADATRSGGTWRHSDVDPTPPVDGATLWLHDGEWTDTAPVPDRTSASATVLAADHFLRCAFDADGWPVGPSVGAAAVAFYQWCDDHLGTSIGPLAAAPDRCR